MSVFFACATVSLAELSSANVVGYQTRQTVAGFNFLAPTFTGVNSESINLQEVTLSGDNALEYVDTLQVLDEGGAATSTYFWTADGWQDENGVKCTKTIQAGESILISTLLDGVNVTFSGEVSKKPIKITSVAGFNFVGNGTPVSIPASSITLSGDNALEYVDTLQILDEGGATVATYFWTSAGWQDENGANCTETIGAGQGVLISTLMDGVEINAPAAL